MEPNESPLITALPPETDYISYLTIVEEYLTTETLPVLHKVLQDETLTINIGWDLVHVLVPMLPASHECLQDIARFGNPREVILKVTEALRLIEFLPAEDEAESTAAEDAKRKLRIDTGMQELPQHVVQFEELLSMLIVLHSRIKTKYPSRFLSTTLQAVLGAFSRATDHREEMLSAIIQMIKRIRGIARPTLPSRRSSGFLSRVVHPAENSRLPAKDPEAPEPTNISQEEPGEAAMELKLSQAFVTHILEEYMLSMPLYDDTIPGLAWTSRVSETLHKERIIPHTKTLSKRFHEEPLLQGRNDAVGSLISLAHDLQIADKDLLLAATTPESPQQTIGANGDEDDPPTSSADIPLSKPGSVLLYAARQASEILYDRKPKQMSGFDIFPHHHALMTIMFTAATSSHATPGSEPPALIDACLVLALLALENDRIGAPKDDAQFREYLQTISLLASNCPNANLRGHAHYIVTSILRSHPDTQVRFAFIKDTLEHCPFENLRTTAVGWLKGEVVEANMSDSTETSTLFSSSITLERLAPYLYPSLHADLVTAPIRSAWPALQANLSFYLAVLNFSYLLITAAPLRQNLDFSDIWKDHDIASSFIQSLSDAAVRFEKEIASGSGDMFGSEEDKQHFQAEFNVLHQTIERVREAAVMLNEH